MGVWEMENIWQVIEIGLISGAFFAAVTVCSFGFLYLFLLIASGQDGMRQDTRWILSHPFYRISGHGKIAYLILCLESSLQFYKQDISAWEWLLRKLWSITECSEESELDICFDSIEKLLPCNVLTRSGGGTPEIRNVQTLYTQTGSAMIVINAILDSIYNIVDRCFSDKMEISAVRYIGKAEGRMREFDVPLPSDEVVQCLLAEQKSSSFGTPFDGLRFSALSKQDSVL